MAVNWKLEIEIFEAPRPEIQKEQVREAIQLISLMKLKENLSEKEKLEKIIKLGLVIKAKEWYGKACIYIW